MADENQGGGEEAKPAASKPAVPKVPAKPLPPKNYNVRGNMQKPPKDRR